MNKQNQKQRNGKYWLNRALNPFYNFWFYIFIAECFAFQKLSAMWCLEQHYKIIALSIWFLILIVTFRYWQEMYYE